ncbi:MAG TPA: PQQ-binding-like beta-propeller repeat protein, partial [Urbifossiella sp.]|nr:PQQ-binding-like beta-propeller repeat protein [Urbifossiella sp.]
ALCLAAPGRADFDAEKQQNWHHWRGPDATGFAAKADPPTTWGSDQNIRWKVPLPGRGSATPIVWGDRVFVLAAVKTDRKATPAELPVPDPGFDRKTDPPDHFYQFLVHCYDRATGRLRWGRIAAEKVPHEGHHPSHSYAAGSPTTDGERLYASFGSAGTFCYDFDGKLLWSRDLGRLNTRLAWGEAVTPVIHGDSLVVNHDQEANAKLFCLDAKTGQTRWEIKREEKTTWSTPLITTVGARTLVVANGTNRVRAYDLATGEEQWAVGGMTINPIPSPVRVGDTAVAMSGYGKAIAVSVPLAARGDLGPAGTGRWKHAAGTPYVPSPLLAGGKLFFTQANDPLLTILDAASGKVLLDRERLPQARSFYASPVGAAGRVYFVDRGGTTVVLKEDAGMDVLAVNKLDDPIDASPALVGKEMFLRGEKFLYCIAE